LGLPIGIGRSSEGGKREGEGGRIVHVEDSGQVAVDESSLLPTPVASPPPIFVVQQDQLQPSLPIDKAQDLDLVVEEPSSNERDHLEENSTAPPTASTLITSPTKPEPSVPHAELVHLRSLLAYASTADEARLLVNSLLSRWGVPYPSLPESEVGDTVGERQREREEQVGRVHGWLLEESSGAREGEEDEVETVKKEDEEETVVLAEVEKEEEEPEKEEEKKEEEEEFFESPSPRVELDGKEEVEVEVVHLQPPVVLAV